MLIKDAHGFDHGARGEVMKVLELANKVFIRKQDCWSPYLQTMSDNQLNDCEVCAENDIRKTITTPVGHIPTPERPFRHQVLDYVEIIKSV